MDRVAIKDVRLIDGTGRDAVSSALVLVEGDRIAWVGTMENSPGSLERFEVLDGTGKTLLPGLIDCHVHLSLDPVAQLFRTVTSDSVVMAALRGVRNARRSLEAGITTVRDLGAKGGAVLDLARAVAEGMHLGPRIVAAGAVVCITGGHGWFIGREADGPDEVRKAVREQLKAGAGVIKLMATGGVMTPGIEVGAPAMTVEELAAGIEEAHKVGRLTATHAIGAQGIKNALRAGIHSVEHGNMLDEEAAHMLRERGAFLVPTLIASTQVVRHAETGGLDEYVVRKARLLAEQRDISFRIALDAGVRIAAATDAGSPYNPHGGLVDELELFVEHGMSPMQALVAATGTAAAVVGLLDQVGTVEVAKQADLLLVEGNPLENVGELRNVCAVVKGGRIVLQRGKQATVNGVEKGEQRYALLPAP